MNSFSGVDNGEGGKTGGGVVGNGGDNALSFLFFICLECKWSAFTDMRRASSISNDWSNVS